MNRAFDCRSVAGLAGTCNGGTPHHRARQKHDASVSESPRLPSRRRFSGASVTLDIVCFSHLRWDFVYQRPNHLMWHAARDGRVYFVEEPTHTDNLRASLARSKREGVVVVTPGLPSAIDADRARERLVSLMRGFADEEHLHAPVLWYYTPMALPWTRQRCRGGAHDLRLDGFLVRVQRQSSAYPMNSTSGAAAGDSGSAGGSCGSCPSRSEADGR